jgi:hypothetical protein
LDQYVLALYSLVLNDLSRDFDMLFESDKKFLDRM